MVTLQYPNDIQQPPPDQKGAAKAAYDQYKEKMPLEPYNPAEKLEHSDLHDGASNYRKQNAENHNAYSQEYAANQEINMPTIQTANENSLNQMLDVSEFRKKKGP